MIEFKEKYGYNVYSQNNEDGIIDECLRRIHLPPIMFTRSHKMANGFAVEFGGADGFYCSNVANLRENKEWAVVMYDLESQSPLVRKKKITPENINDKGVVYPECNILSIDIDGNDYAVWKAYKGKPAIIIIEINSSLDPSVEFFHPDRGASYITMLRLGEGKGYFLLCHTGNMVFVANEYKNLFPEIGDPYDYEKFFDKKWLQAVA